MYTVLFKNADIITMQDDRIQMHGHVGITGNKIAYLGSVLPTEVAERTIDCAGKILMPGLINTHAHTAACIMRGYADDYTLQDWLHKKVFPADARTTREDVTAGSILGFAEMISTGTTSVSNTYFFIPEVAKAALEAGIRASLSTSIIVPTNKSFQFESHRAIKGLREVLEEGYHGADDGRIRIEPGIHAEYTSTPDIWQKICQIADDHSLGIQMHLCETQQEVQDCIGRYGISPPAIFQRYGVFQRRVTAAHCVWLTHEDMDILAENQVNVSHNPTSNLKLACGIARIKDMQSRGINVSLGTDGACSNNTYDMLKEVKLAALLAKGISMDPLVLSAYDALKLATVNGAIAQGRSDVGQIREGMKADIILLDMDTPSTVPQFDNSGAIVYSATGNNVSLTMVNGKILYENDAFITIDIDKARHDVKEAAKRLFA